MPFKSIYNKNLGFIDIFEHNREVQTIKNILIYIIFVMNFFSGDLFRGAPYSLMLLIDKDVLLHY